MIVVPAIDVRGGKVVRLKQGRLQEEKVYGADPSEVARHWAAEGAPEARGVHLGGHSFGVDSPLQRRLGGVARGFLLRRWGVLRSMAAPRALAHEAAVVGWGMVRHRTLLPLRARIEGWRLAEGDQRVLPRGAVDERIGFRESLRRLRSAR